MNLGRIKRIWLLVLLTSVLLIVFGRLDGAVVNLTDATVAGEETSTMEGVGGTFVAGMVEGALYRRPVDADDSGAGSGVFRDLYRLDSNSGAEAGYNRSGVMDAEVPNGFDPFLTVDELVEDSTGTAYVFVVDTNEPGNATEKFVSLDDFKIFIGDAADLSPHPQSLFELGNELGFPVYDMNGSGVQNHVLLDYSLYSGSGEMDLFVFVPKVFFGNAAGDQQVYVYSEFGSYTGAAGFDPAAGPEQVSIPGKSISGTVDPLLLAVPEPAWLWFWGAAGLLPWHRRRAGP